MAYLSSENKYVCDFCGRGIFNTSPYGAFGMEKEGWNVELKSVKYTVPKKKLKGWFTYSERLADKNVTELKCDVCIRKEKINKIKDALHTR